VYLLVSQDQIIDLGMLEENRKLCLQLHPKSPLFYYRVQASNAFLNVFFFLNKKFIQIFHIFFSQAKTLFYFILFVIS
jgi:hypothetical protein